VTRVTRQNWESVTTSLRQLRNVHHNPSRLIAVFTTYASPTIAKPFGRYRKLLHLKSVATIVRLTARSAANQIAKIKVRESGGLVMITKAALALILFGLTSSANAMTVIFKDYKAATSDEKAFYYLYLDGVREGVIELNVVLEEKRQQPLFCLPEKLALTVGQAEDIMTRQAEKITDPDQLPIGLLLAQGLQNTFPCDEKH
jgi:Ssp1 endopeptidase immunity protein Rap1a